MKLTNTLIENLSEKHVRRFLHRLPSVTHMRDDLKQEAAMAIARYAHKWVEGRQSMDAYLYIYSRKAMQQCASLQAGPVCKPADDRDFAGAEQASTHLRNSITNMPTQETPETFMEQRDANAIVQEFVQKRAALFSGKGKLASATIMDALTDLMLGDSYREIAKRYGCSHQRVNALATQASV